MVTADVERSTRQIADAFEDMDFTTLTVVGGLAAVGVTVAGTVGGLLVSASPGGFDRFGRMEAALMGLGAFVAAVAGVQYLPRWLSGPFAVGAIVVVGAAAFGTLFGMRRSRTDWDDRFRRMLDASDASDVAMSAAPSISGCATCGQPRTHPGQPVRPPNVEVPPGVRRDAESSPGAPRSIGQGQSVPEGAFRSS